MSRIHEALKKAQEQRALEQPAAAAVVLPEKITIPIPPPPRVYSVEALAKGT